MLIFMPNYVLDFQGWFQKIFNGLALLQEQPSTYMNFAHEFPILEEKPEAVAKICQKPSQGDFN